MYFGFNTVILILSMCDGHLFVDINVAYDSLLFTPNFNLSPECSTREKVMEIPCCLKCSSIIAAAETSDERFFELSSCSYSIIKHGRLLETARFKCSKGMRD